MARTQKSVRVDSELVEAASRRSENFSQLVEKGLRTVLGIAEISVVDSDKYFDHDLPTRQEFDTLAAEVQELKQAAERAGAL